MIGFSLKKRLTVEVLTTPEKTANICRKNNISYKIKELYVYISTYVLILNCNMYIANILVLVTTATLYNRLLRTLIQPCYIINVE